MNEYILLHVTLYLISHGWNVVLVSKYPYFDIYHDCFDLSPGNQNFRPVASV